jgi:CheY-like chemotaxis protein/two-component sensor histidine kinase
LEIIERNGRVQAQIIEDLLDMNRIISGKIRLDVAKLNLANVVEAGMETVRPAAVAKGVRLVTDLDPSACQVMGDPNRLQQVIWNLLSNAVKFTPRGGQVQVALKRVNSHVEVSVIDTGVGIKPEFLPYVFDRFRQADSSITRTHAGLGLGLAIVKQLIELHGGTVRVESAGEEKGASFTVALPSMVVDPEHRPEAAPPLARPGTHSAHDRQGRVLLRGVKVLVVDDEPDARALVKRLLEDCQASVQTASSAAEAIERMRTDRFDVLVSDIGMPGEDGYTLIRKVRALGQEGAGALPALALTAYARSEDRLNAIRAGFNMHVVKPVEPVELVTMVASLAGAIGRPQTKGADTP